MQQKYDTYKRYGWSSDKDWQVYLDNIYPVPSRDKVEKIRRKWYKKNKDPEFDVDFQPDLDAQNAQNNQRQNGQQGHQHRHQYQQHPAYGQANLPDKWPALKNFHLGLLVCYLITYPIGMFTSKFLFVGMLCGVLRKAGIPQFKLEWLQNIIFTEEFGTFTYAIAILMTQGGIFLNLPLIIAVVLTLCAEFKKILDSAPNTPLISHPTVKQYILKGAASDLQDYGRHVKSDIEVYAGFYLIVTALLGSGNFVGMFFYWQMQRMRYMMSPQLQAAFSRFDKQILSYLNHPYCPKMLLGVYIQLKTMLSGMTDIQAQQERVQQSGGGIMGAVKNSCQIF